MALSANSLAARISSDSGLTFLGNGGLDSAGNRTYELVPAYHPPAHTFSLIIQVGWRSVDMAFRPGNFSGELIAAMGIADQSGRAAFAAVLRSSTLAGAQIGFLLNGQERSFDDVSIWDVRWANMRLTMRKGMLPINDGDTSADEDLIATWVARLSASILALLPLEGDETLEQASSAELANGFPEGAKTVVVVNRYERDRRNRAASLAIHGHICKACDSNLGSRYGAVAAGLVEIHHTTPVSELGPHYIVDPRTDLIPLCPNCHAVAHRRTPPFAIHELRALLRIDGELG